MAKAILVLEDGRSFEGISFGADGERFGEMVFNTSLSGYQEILTDPSYAGQIVCMTYPLIGNYGVNDQDVESRRPWVEGFVVREASRVRSNFRSTKSLQDYLKENDIVGIEHIDTRALVRHIRDKGAMRSAISTVDTDAGSLLTKVLASPEMANRELASAVTVEENYAYQEAETRPVGSVLNAELRSPELGSTPSLPPAKPNSSSVAAAVRPNPRNSIARCSSRFLLSWSAFRKSSSGVSPISPFEITAA